MNIYVRYFDYDTLAHSSDELLSFLESIHEIPMTQAMANEIRNYAESDIPYPKRYKIRPRVYFIMIKTTANTMEEFKMRKLEKEQGTPEQVPATKAAAPKEMRITSLTSEKYGWYKGCLHFKRVIRNSTTGKCSYVDASFTALVHTYSPLQCYHRIVSHLKGREDIDSRSQFPSAKGNNFIYEYVGEQINRS